MFLSRRLIVSCLLLAAGCFAIGLWSLQSGAVPLETGQIIAALLGDAPRNITLVVTEWRLPRVLMALLIGAALGVSGAIFQSLMRNPLGSPDVMGFNTGAWSGVLVAMVLFGQHLTAIALAAMAGGIVTSLIVWLLAWRNGIETFRLIIIGIGIRAMLVAFNTWLLLQASLETALTAGLWNAGSLNGLTWAKTWPSAPLIIVMLTGAALLVRRMRLLEMGDDSACALGVSVERSRLMLMLVAVSLTAAATALAGPISFIALVAPHIARRLSGTARWGLTQSALCGALLLLAADACAQQLFMPYQLPVGVVTVSLGGIYLIVLLIQESRKKMTESVARLRGDQLTLGYGSYTVAKNLNVSIPDGHFTAIIGPNGCGKSTLLRTLSRLMTPVDGHVWLDGEQIQRYASKEVARRIGLLAQNATTPGDITVQELVARGRYPHQPLFTRWRKEDADAVASAMRATGITSLATQSVDTLSGGQRQRAWIAMVLAQETSIMLLDEPTTWLDISHQIDLLELLSDLNREKGYTLAAVLHDLNQACRYATHLIALREGNIVAQGAPKEIVTAELIEKIYGLRCMIIDDPVAGTPLVVPLGRR
ncbi:Ferric enterobactin transport system permeaseprotein FepG [Salmonella enterica subsp. enterica]|nr:Ferric enterobactin transport system permeaseprotein FepG [Salmonella enterica subsp. enterica]